MQHKRSLMRRWISMTLSALMMTGILIAPVHAQPWVYEEKSVENIASGTSHQRILRFGEQGWQNVNVIRVDLTDKNIMLELLQSASGVSQRDTLTNMMKQMDQPVAGINADFFYLTKPDSPMGIMARDGQIVSGPVLEKPFSSLIVKKDGSADLTGWNNHMYVSTENGKLFSIGAYNKITWNYHIMTILDKNWGQMTPGAADEYRDLVEVVVTDGKVKEIRRGLPAVEIPQDGYVLLASGHQGQLLYEGIRPGERITFHPQTVPRLEEIRLAVGGGTVLVQNGQTVSFTEPVSGNHPRTAVGINRSGDQLILVTVDGRHTSYTGVDGQKLAALMIELGSHKAILMDGGGSTTMAVRGLGESDISLTNTPSDGSQRRIINGLGIRSTAPIGDLTGLLFKSDQDRVFINHPMNLEINAYDSFYQPYPVSANAVQYRIVAGSGRIADQQLIPESAGNLTVEASYQGKTVSKTIDVLSEVAGLQLHVPRYTVSPGEHLSLMVEGIDPRGYRAPLSLNRVQLSDEKGLGTFQNSLYQAGQQQGTTIIRASYNGNHAAVPMAVGLRRASAGKLENYSPLFLGYPAEVKGRVSVVAGGNVNQNAVQLDYDLTGSPATTAAYVVFSGQGIPVPADATRIAVQAKAADSAPHWVRGQLKDANGHSHILDFKQGIDWTGWKTLEAVIPQGAVKPLYLERLYVVEPDPFFKTKGTLLFDGIEFLTPFELPKLTPLESGGQVNDPQNRLPEQAENQWLIYNGSGDRSTEDALIRQLEKGFSKIYLTGTVPTETRTRATDRFVGGTGGFSALQIDQKLVITLDNSTNGLRRTNFQQWPWLLSTLKGNLPDQIVILMPQPVFGPQGFSDELEAKLLVDQLTGLADAGKQVFVFHGSQNFGTEMIDGVRFIGTGKSGQKAVGLYKSGGSLFYELVDISSNQSIPAQKPAAAPDQTSVGNGVSFRVGQRHYTVNGEQIQLDTAPYIKDGRLMVPVAHISRALGISRENVEWDGISETVLVRTLEGRTLLMTIGSSQLWVDDQQLDMGVAAEITNDRSFVPISRFATAMSIEYQWNPNTETVIFQQQ